MKTLLMSSMALGAVLMLGANQPVDATVVQPIATDSHSASVMPVYWRGGGFGFHVGPRYAVPYGYGYYHRYRIRPVLPF